MAASGAVWSSDSESKMVICYSKTYCMLEVVSSSCLESHNINIPKWGFYLQTLCDPYTAEGHCRDETLRLTQL